MESLDNAAPLDNRKFGFFFTFLFSLASAYFFYYTDKTWAYTFLATSLIFLVITLVKSDALLILNKLWMQFGFLLSRLVSPIVIGVIFFGFFSPVAILMRLTGRDELRLKLKKQTSHWIIRNETVKSDSFTNQF